MLPPGWVVGSATLLLVVLWDQGVGSWGAYNGLLDTPANTTLILEPVGKVRQGG